MALKRFPIGVQDFAVLREDGKYYVDKTDLIYKLANSDRYYFLSRPRRFGKSLLVSTLQYYFEGRKELFAGLAMEKLETEWKKYPVFKLSFAGNKFITEEDLADTLNLKLGEWERQYGLEPSDKSAWGVRFELLIKATHESTGMPPVVLVDEYDAPLLDSMENPELQLTLKNEMRKLFSPLLLLLPFARIRSLLRSTLTITFVSLISPQDSISTVPSRPTVVFSGVATRGGRAIVEHTTPTPTMSTWATTSL